MRSRLGARLAMLAAVPVALLGLTAAPASADPGEMAYCEGRQSIWGDSWQIHGSAGTVCDGTADYLKVSVYIRHLDKLGSVTTCGIWSQADAIFTNTVTASASSCVSSGTGDTYWIYSEHYASIDGQVFDFTAGDWDSPS